jgi:hypothetical protein
MITLIVSVALSSSAIQAQAPARKAYAACLSKYVQKAGSDNMAKDAFDAGLQSACTSEQQAFKAAIVADDMKRGAKRADAEEGAQLQIEDYLANARDSYEAPKE